MDTAEDQLQSGEYLIYETKPHLIIFTLPLAIILVSACVEALDPRLHKVALIFLGLGILGMLMSWITYNYTRFMITNRRFVRRYGFISRSTSTLMLTRIESVDVSQTIFGRILDYGIIMLTGTGGTHDIAVNIPHPFHFRTMLQQAIYDAEQHNG